MSNSLGLSLYDIKAELLNLLVIRETALDDEALTEETRKQVLGEVDIKIREFISKELRKVDGIAYYLQEFLERADAAKEEAKRLRARAEMWEARHERLEGFVKGVMQMTGETRLEGNAHTLKLVKCPPSVEIAQPELVPEEFRKIEIGITLGLWNRILFSLENASLGADGILAELHSMKSVETGRSTPMKSKIAEALKRGDGVPGCALVTDKLSLRVE